jgi:hypothetical protein
MAILLTQEISVKTLRLSSVIAHGAPDLPNWILGAQAPPKTSSALP